MSNPTSKKDPRKQLAVVAAVASIISPTMVATPAAAAVESAQKKVALLRELALAQDQETPEHVVLRKAVDEARQANRPNGIADGCTMTGGTSGNHTSHHYNCTNDWLQQS